MPISSPMGFIFLLGAAFLGAFVDAIAGGGGLITVPAYLISGFSPHAALATNKLSASFGSLASSIEFFREGKVSWPLVKYIIPCTFLGAVLGVRSVLILPQAFLYPIVVVLILTVGVYSFFKKDLGLTQHFVLPYRRQIAGGMILGLVMGFYDGFFGPGTGSFLLFAFIRFFKMDFLHAGANTKILNFTSNITSLGAFALAGQIHWPIGLLAGAFALWGSRVGTRVALRRGPAFVRPIFLVMSLAVFLKLLWDLPR
ncbi:putative membrane protein YfcA [Clostridiaceae bacterium JG1575]|nr:putative membrane protein YfcA [Clostridiaceae bacterium JG1575]